MASLLLALIYISFISLGLPDAVLGAAWPVMHQDLQVQVSDMGILSMIFSLFTIVSSLNAERLTTRFGTAKVTAASVGLTAIAILGFSYSRSFISLMLWAVPYGLGAGGVDAALNNYVASHYASRHMSWLHCMWGIGACAGPYVVGYALSSGLSWDRGYLYIGLFQVILSLILFATLGLWKINRSKQSQPKGMRKPLTMRQVFAIPGAFHIFLAFFAYCAVEQTAGQWSSSYFVMKDGVHPEQAASLGSLFYIGITVGRAIGGFFAIKLNDTQMIRLGQTVLIFGVLILFLPFGKISSIVGLCLIGLGCAPIYPSVIHSTPGLFGTDNSQAIIGMQMAFAYVGTLIMPPLYGLIAQYLSAALLPVYLLVILGVMIINLEILNRRHKKKVDFITM